MERDQPTTATRPRRLVFALMLAVGGMQLLSACPGINGPADDDDSADDHGGPDDDDSAGDDDDSAGDDDDSAGDDDDSAGDDDDSIPFSDAQLRGAELWLEYCGMCHGDQGQGYAADQANALSNASFLAAASDEFLHSSIRHGRPGTPMSAWAFDYGGPLSDADITDIIAWLRRFGAFQLSGLDDIVVSGDAQTAEPQYQQLCANCHGPDGQGGSVSSVANPWFLEAASDGFLLHAINKGRPGTTMPAWEAVLSEQERYNLVALLRSWATPVEDSKVPPFQPDLSDHLIGAGGPAADFSDQLRDGRFVSMSEVHDALLAGQEFIILDARPGSDYLTEHISGAISAPFYRMEEAIAVLPHDRWIVTYCGCPHTLSGDAVDSLLAAGFSQAAVLDEGYYGWLSAGYPISSGSERY